VGGDSAVVEGRGKKWGRVCLAGVGLVTWGGYPQKGRWGREGGKEGGAERPIPAGLQR